MTCKKCGSNVVDTAKFCPNCGENLQNYNLNSNNSTNEDTNLNNSIKVEGPINTVQNNDIVEEKPVENIVQVEQNQVATKKKSNTWIIWLVLGILGGLILIGIAISIVFKSFTQGIKDGLEDFKEEIDAALRDWRRGSAVRAGH